MPSRVNDKDIDVKNQRKKHPVQELNSPMSRRRFMRSSVMATAAGMTARPHAEPVPVNPDDPLFSFGLIADIQYADIPPRGSRYHRESLGKLEACVDVFNGMELAYVIDLGDMIDRDLDSFAPVLSRYEQLQAPWRVALGNHDFTGNDHPGILALLGMDQSYFSWRVHGWRFIVLDGNDISGFAWPRDSERAQEAARIIEDIDARGGRNGRSYNGGLGARQLTWLWHTLQEAVDAVEPVLVFCHFPIYPDNTHNLLNTEVLLELLSACPQVVAYFNGHNHRGNYGIYQGIHCVNIHGVVEAEDTNAFATVDVHKGHLMLNGFGRQESRKLNLPT